MIQYLILKQSFLNSYCCVHFVDGDSGVQGRYVIYAGSFGWKVADVGFKFISV